MTRKSAQLQIRVTPEQKRRLKRLARDADLDVSQWVLAQLLPDEGQRFARLAAGLDDAERRRFVLAELADFFERATPAELERAVREAPPGPVDPAARNQLAALVELACARKGVALPSWTAGVAVPAEPRFGSPLNSVRLHLLCYSPAALRRRNLFADSTLGDRV